MANWRLASRESDNKLLRSHICSPLPAGHFTTRSPARAQFVVTGGGVVPRQLPPPPWPSASSSSTCEGT
uniref:Uncharacterized protein n=1 Tax=Oryza meridionalis TaxID=40149 RepID=A0A0E0EPI5_9ORYZ